MFLITAADIQPALATGSAIMVVIDYLPMQRRKVMTKLTQQFSLFVLIFHKAIYWYWLREGSRMKW